jgi:hypothetical protein
MKKGELLKRIKAQGCIFVKHGKKHDVYKNPRTSVEKRVPRKVAVFYHSRGTKPSGRSIFIMSPDGTSR